MTYAQTLTPEQKQVVARLLRWPIWVTGSGHWYKHRFSFIDYPSYAEAVEAVFIEPDIRKDPIFTLACELVLQRDAMQAALATLANEYAHVSDERAAAVRLELDKLRDFEPGENSITLAELRRLATVTLPQAGT